MISLQHLVIAYRVAESQCDAAEQVAALEALIDAARRRLDELAAPRAAQGDPPPVPEKVAGFISKSVHA